VLIAFYKPHDMPRLRLLRRKPLDWWGAAIGRIAARLSGTQLAHMVMFVDRYAVEVSLSGTWVYDIREYRRAVKGLHGWFEVTDVAWSTSDQKAFLREMALIGPRLMHWWPYSWGHLLHLFTRGRFRWWHCTSPAIVALGRMGLEITTPCALPADIWKQLNAAGFRYVRYAEPRRAAPAAHGAVNTA
jgi:hypothetical protein